MSRFASDAGFELDPRLAADTFPIGDMPLARVLLHDDARFPWLVLVPRVPGLRELHELERESRQQLWDEVDRAARALVALHAPDKLNVATLGNVVPQLHVHVVGRFQTDPAWPRPVWGAGTREPYAAEAREAERAALRAALGSDLRVG